jgi:hypothetical protein
VNRRKLADTKQLPSGRPNWAFFSFPARLIFDKSLFTHSSMIILNIPSSGDDCGQKRILAYTAFLWGICLP